MSSLYPNAIDGQAQIEIAKDNITRIDAKLINDIRSAILNIEEELGIVPSGTYQTVRARLDAIDLPDLSDLEASVSSLESGLSIAQANISSAQQDIVSIQEEIDALDLTPVEPEIKILGHADISSSYIDLSGPANSTISFPPAPNDLIIKRIDLGFYPDIGNGVVDINTLIFIEDIQIDGISIMNGVIPSTALDPRHKADTPVFNRLVTAGQVVTIITSTSLTNSGGIFTQPLLSYVDGTSDTDLEKETYLGSDPLVHTGPPAGALIMPGTGVTNATTILTINSAPLAAGDEIVFNKAVGEPDTLTGSPGARTPGSDDFDATIGTVSGLATEIAAAINDSSNNFSSALTAIANTPSSGDITIEHFGGEIGNFATMDSTTTPAGGITPASASFSGGESETLEITFEAAPANMTLNRLYTTIISGQGSGALGASLAINQITVNNGPNLLSGYLGTAYTSNGPGDSSILSAGVLASPKLGLSINAGDVVRITVVNDPGIPGGIIAGWSVTLN